MLARDKLRQITVFLIFIAVQIDLIDAQVRMRAVGQTNRP